MRSRRIRRCCPRQANPSRERVLEVERWGDEVFQSVPRRIIDAAFLRRPAAMESYAGDAKLPLPTALMRPAMPLTARLMAIKNKAGDEPARADLAALPGQLDRIDGWIEEGLLGGERPNAADLQVGSTIRLLMSIGDVGRCSTDARRGAWPATSRRWPARCRRGCCPRSGSRATATAQLGEPGGRGAGTPRLMRAAATCRAIFTVTPGGLSRPDAQRKPAACAQRALPSRSAGP